MDSPRVNGDVPQGASMDGASGAPKPPVGYEWGAPAFAGSGNSRDGGATAPAAERQSHLPQGGGAYLAASQSSVSQPATGGSRAGHFLKWTLAMFGVFALYLLLQVVMATIGATALVAVDLIAGGGDALYDNGLQVVVVASQLLAVAVFLPWWRRVRRGSFGERRKAMARNAVPVARTAAALLLVGFAAQFFVSGLLGFVELLFPEMMAEYAELMEDAAVGVFAMLQMVSTAILAPINEEIVCRGVMLEYALRAVSPGWESRDRARRLPVSARAFWIANILQALAFGVLHMNIIQGGYAFALGVLQGWVFWRTGRLGYAMLLHFALNASSYLVEPLAPALNALPPLVVFVFFAVMLIAGVLVFERTWHVSDALGEEVTLPDPAEPPAPRDEAPHLP